MGSFAFVVFLAVVAVALAKPAPNKQPTKSRQVQQHLEDVEAFPCKEPQMRSFLLSNMPQLSTGIYSPPVTVLHRCDKESGCCSQTGFECGPIAEETIFRTFRVSQLDANNKKKIYFDQLEFTNHTACGCQRLELPK